MQKYFCTKFAVPGFNSATSSFLFPLQCCSSNTPCPALQPCSPAAQQSIQTPEFNNSWWLHIQAKCQNLISKPSIQNLLHRYRYYLGGGLAGEVWRNLAIWTCITVMQHRGPPPPSTNQPFYKQTYFPSDHSDIQIFSGKVFLIEMLILRVYQASQCAACD